MKSPMHGDFFILFLIFHMSNHSSYLRLGWIFYIIYYVSRLFLMNLGDSFGISIFVGKSSRFAPKISASHFFWGSRCWNCNDLRWFIVRISDGFIVGFGGGCGIFIMLILNYDEQMISRG